VNKANISDTAVTSVRQPAQSEAVARVLDVTKYFGSFWGGDQVRALSQVAFEVQRGEVFGLLGPPGAGKSTMLRLLAGKLRPTEGKVEVFGRSPRRAGIRARIGYLAEKSDQTRRTQTAGTRGLMERLFALVSYARGGVPGERPQSRQPLAGLFTALINDPDLLLLDEPFAGLDTAGAEELKRRLLAVSKRGKTIVLSSQWLGEAVGVCDRVAVCRWGTIEAVGTFEEYFSHPAAVCLLAPVLSPATSKRLVRLIREDLHCGAVPEDLSAESSSTEAPAVISNVPVPPAPAPAPVAPDEVLAPLVKPSCPAPPSEVPDRTFDTVDHKRLAELTRHRT
jgi:ABC-2 type transport system ATP-binding protein